MKTDQIQMDLSHLYGSFYFINVSSGDVFFGNNKKYKD